MLDERAANIVRKGRLQPGKLFLVDLAQGRIVPDEETKRAVATRRPYAEWVEREQLRLAELPAAPAAEPPRRVAAQRASSSSATRRRT